MRYIKKPFAALVAIAGMYVHVGFAQSQFTVDNISNTSTDPSDTQNGLVWTYGVDHQHLTPIDPNIYPTLEASVWAGSSPDTSTMTWLADFTGADALFVIDYGRFVDWSSAVFNVNGIGDNGTAWIELEVWLPGGHRGDFAPVTFAQVTGGGSVNGNPPNLPATLTSMPAIVVPEPSTFALAGLGLASLVIFRRRK
jgi:hypothetical protein